MPDPIPGGIPPEAIKNEEGEQEKIRLQGRELYKRLIATVEDSTGIELRPNHYSDSVFDWRRQLQKEIDGKHIEIDLRVGDQVNTSLFIYIGGAAYKGNFQTWSIRSNYSILKLESHKDRIDDSILLLGGEKLYRTYVEHQMEMEVSIDRVVFDDIKETAEKLKSELAKLGISLGDFEDKPLPRDDKKRAKEKEKRSQIVNQYMNSEESSEETPN